MPQNSPTATTLADRAVVRLSGEDVRGFVNGLVTQDVMGELPVWAGLLTPQGKCLFDFLVWADGDDVLLDCETEAADDLIKRLGIYRLRRPILIERDEGLAVHWAADGSEGFADPRLPELGRRWLAAASGPAPGWLEHRLRLGVCEGRGELGGVSFTKGCFVGQENTARMNWRSKVNRRLVVVEGDGGERARVTYPELGLAVVHARAGDWPESAIVPAWLQSALS